MKEIARANIWRAFVSHSSRIDTSRIYSYILHQPPSASFWFSPSLFNQALSPLKPADIQSDDDDDDIPLATLYPRRTNGPGNTKPEKEAKVSCGLKGIEKRAPNSSSSSCSSEEEEEDDDDEEEEQDDEFDGFDEFDDIVDIPEEDEFDDIPLRYRLTSRRRRRDSDDDYVEEEDSAEAPRQDAKAGGLAGRPLG